MNLKAVLITFGIMFYICSLIVLVVIGQMWSVLLALFLVLAAVAFFIYNLAVWLL